MIIKQSNICKANKAKFNFLLKLKEILQHVEIQKWMLSCKPFIIIMAYIKIWLAEE